MGHSRPPAANSVSYLPDERKHVFPYCFDLLQLKGSNLDESLFKNAAAMARAAHMLKGRHDFRCFETEWPNRMSSVRTITHLSVNRAGDYIWIDVEADGFLYNMVRAIAGTLMNVGRGYWPEAKVAEILAAQDRKQAGPTAPAKGLFLMRVTY